MAETFRRVYLVPGVAVAGGFHGIARAGGSTMLALFDTAGYQGIPASHQPLHVSLDDGETWDVAGTQPPTQGGWYRDSRMGSAPNAGGGRTIHFVRRPATSAAHGTVAAAWVRTENAGASYIEVSPGAETPVGTSPGNPVVTDWRETNFYHDVVSNTMLALGHWRVPRDQGNPGGIADALAAPAAALTGLGGGVDPGPHRYVIVRHQLSGGETFRSIISAPSNSVTATQPDPVQHAGERVTVTVPPGDANTVQREVYRTKGSGSQSIYYLNRILTNPDEVEFADTVADDDLTDQLVPGVDDGDSLAYEIFPVILADSPGDAPPRQLHTILPRFTGADRYFLKPRLQYGQKMVEQNFGRATAAILYGATKMFVAVEQLGTNQNSPAARIFSADWGASGAESEWSEIVMPASSLGPDQPNQTAEVLCFARGSFGRLFAGGNGRVTQAGVATAPPRLWVSDDAGETWTDITHRLPHDLGPGLNFRAYTVREIIACGPTIVACLSIGHSGGSTFNEPPFRISRDNGETWTTPVMDNQTSPAAPYGYGSQQAIAGQASPSNALDSILLTVFYGYPVGAGEIWIVDDNIDCSGDPPAPGGPGPTVGVPLGCGSPFYATPCDPLGPALPASTADAPPTTIPGLTPGLVLGLGFGLGILGSTDKGVTCGPPFTPTTQET